MAENRKNLIKLGKKITDRADIKLSCRVRHRRGEEHDHSLGPGGSRQAPEVPPHV